MILLKQFYFQNPDTSKKTTGDLFDKIRAALKKSKIKDASILFYFSEILASNKKASATGRLIKKYPEMRPFKGVFSRHYNEPGKVIGITNLDNRFMEANPDGKTGSIDAKILSMIAHGIPKKYPFQFANFMVENIEALDLRQDNHCKVKLHGNEISSIVCPWIPCINLSSHWWTSYGNRHLTATVALEVPESEISQLPPLPVRTAQLLASLGKVQNSKLIIKPDIHEIILLEKFAKDAKDIADKYRSDPFQGKYVGDVLKNIQPHRKNVFQKIPKRAGTAFPKETIIEIFSSIGYEYDDKDSSTGVHLLRKRSKLNNMIEVNFDLERITGELAGELIIRGPLYQHQVPFLFPCVLGVDALINSHPITDDASCENAVKISGLLAQHLENTFVSEMENLYGPAPAWFE